MSKRNRNAALWKAVQATLDSCWQSAVLAARHWSRARAWHSRTGMPQMQIMERLEPRQLLTSTVYVDQSATGTDAGSSWTNAYTDLQPALMTAVSGETIKVAQGIYTPGSSETSTFLLINGVSIYGGYPSGGSTTANPSAYPTILSGGSAVYHVVTANGVNSTAVLNGLTITGGNANGSGTGQNDGGGIYAPDGDPTIDDCDVIGNSANFGGGIYITNASPTIDDSEISDNFATDNGAGIFSYYTEMIVENCTISGDTADGQGGGIYSSATAMTVTDSTITGDHAENGGGVYDAGFIPEIYAYATLYNCTINDDVASEEGGGIAIHSALPTITDCTIDGDSANKGGGLSIYNWAPDWDDSHHAEDFTGGLAYNMQPILTGCVINGDKANNGGGGFYDYDSAPYLMNCSISGDKTYHGDGGGILTIGYDENQIGTTTLINCSVTGDTAVDGDGGGLAFEASSQRSSCYTDITGTNISGDEAENGGGIFFSNAGKIYLAQCTLDDDTVSGDGGGIYSTLADPVLVNCTFAGDGGSQCNKGGGVYLKGIYEHYVNPSAQLTDCLFEQDIASVGGGIYNQTCSPTLTNCTFSDNTATSSTSNSGGAIYNANSTLTIVNSILWSDGGGEIHNSSSTAMVTYSDVSNGYTGTGNINTDPLFVANPSGTAFGSLALQPTSPCAGSGSVTAISTTGVTTDLAGGPRTVHSKVDIGAYESDYLYVDATASGSSNGYSWANAFPSLQRALTTAAQIQSSYPGALITILVARGTYVPTSVSGGNPTFQLIDDVTIQGGYAGHTGSGATNAYQMGFTTYLSGTNTYSVVNVSSTNATAALENVTIINGNASSGGGLYDDAGNATITNCIFTTDKATDGAAVYCVTASPTFVDCTFSSNSASFAGGAIYNATSTGHAPICTNCTFTSNYAADDGGAVYGNVSLNECVFSENGIGTASVITINGGAIYDDGLSITDSTFTDNSAKMGGAIYDSGTSPTLINCVFAGNTASTQGGAIYNSSSSPLILNCTFTTNSASSSNTGGAIYDSSSNPTIINSIFWNDADGEISGSSSTPAVAYSDVDGGFAGQNNINANPYFVSPPGTLSLSPNSPGINAGNDLALPSTDLTDIVGNPRVADFTVDMGAYELMQPAVAISSVPSAVGDQSLSFAFTATPAIYGDGVTTSWFVYTPTGELFQTGTSTPVNFTPNVSGTWTTKLIATDTNLTLSTTVSTNTYVYYPLSITGNSEASPFVPYTLDLNNGGASFDHWFINWGDSTTTTVANTATVATHTFVTGSTNRTITAFAENAAGTVLGTAVFGPVATDSTTAGSLSDVEGIAVQTDGQIVALTSAGLERFNADGAQDFSFGEDGIAPLPLIGSSSYTWSSVAIGTAGYIAIGGAGNSSLVMALFNSGGSLVQQPSVDSGLDSVGGNVQCNAIAYSGSDIIVAGEDQQVEDSHKWSSAVIAEFNTDGTLTWSHSVGSATRPYSYNAYEGIAIAGDGSGHAIRAYAYAGYGEHGKGTYAYEVIDKFTSSGTFTAGTTKYPDDLTIAAQTNGTFDIGNGFSIQQFTSTGGTDTSFNTTGTLSTPFNVLTILPNSGHLLVVGEYAPNGFVLAQFNADGHFDAAFGNDGIFNGLFDYGSSDLQPTIAVENGDYEVAAIDGDNNAAPAVDITQFGTLTALPIAATLAPTVSPISIPAATESLALTLTATASPDANNGDSLSFSWTLTPPGGTATSYSNNSGVTVPILTLGSAVLNTTGSWTASLTVRDVSLTPTLSTTVSNTFTVVAPTILAITGPGASDEGETVNFLLTGLDASTTASWTTTFNGTSTSIGTGTMVSFTPSEAGTYSIQATSSGTVATLILTSTYVAPVISIVGPAVGFDGQALTFSSDVTQAPGVDDLLTYQWNVLNSDGSTLSIISSNSYSGTLSTFVMPGLPGPGTASSVSSITYEITLAVEDSHNGTFTTVQAPTFGLSVNAAPTLSYAQGNTLAVSQSNQFQWATAQMPPTAAVAEIFEDPLGENMERNSSAIAVLPNGMIAMAGNLLGEGGFDNFGSGGWLALFNSNLTADSNFGPNGTGVEMTGVGGINPYFIEEDVDSEGDDELQDYAGEPGSIYTGQIFALGINLENNDIVAVGAMYVPTGASNETPVPNDFGLTEDYILSPWVGEYLSTPEIAPNGDFIPAGAPDPNFNDGQPFVLNISQGEGAADAVAFDGSNILVGGSQAVLAPCTSDGTGFVQDYLLFELTASGTLATTLNGTGIAQQPWIDGKMPQPQEPWYDFPQDPTASLYNVDTPGFGQGVDFSNITTWAGMLADITRISVIDDPGNSDNGNILAGGMAATELPEFGTEQWSHEIGLVEWNASGTLSSGFGSSHGTVIISDSTFYSDPPVPQLLFGSMEQVSDGGILVVGVADPLEYAVDGEPTDYDTNYVVFAEYNSSGNLNTSYSTGGIIITSVATRDQDNSNFYASENYGSDLLLGGEFAFLPDGDTAFLSPGNGINADGESFADIVTLTLICSATGTLDTAFGSGGEALIGLPDNLLDTLDSMVAINGGLFIEGCAYILDDGSYNYDEPLVVRYNLPSYTPTADLIATATSAGPINLTWTDNGLAAGYEVERSSSVSGGTLVSPVVLGSVGQYQTSYSDASAVPGETYDYGLLPFDSSDNILSDFGAVTQNSVTAFPAGATHYTLLETLSVTLNNSGSPVTSTLLPSGTSYLIVASDPMGTNGITPASIGLASGYGADANGWYSTSNISYAGNALDSVPFGLGIGGVLPSWDALSAGNHSFVTDYVGQGAALTFEFLDADNANLGSGLGSQSMTVQIYVAGSISGGGSPPNTTIRWITSPAVNTNGLPPTISELTSVNIVCVNTGGGTAGWTLQLLSASDVVTTLAMSNVTAGAAPLNGQSVATIDPTHYPNGIYTLELTDGSGVVAEAFPLDIESDVKLGDLQVSATDLEITTSSGSTLAVSREYDSDQVDTSDLVGNGWTVNLLNAQLQVTSGMDSVDSSESVLRTGNLVSMTVPDGGQFAFEFAPQTSAEDWTYGDSPTSVPYAPDFQAIDGSGATLNVIPQILPSDEAADFGGTYGAYGSPGGTPYPYALSSSVSSTWGPDTNSVTLAYDAENNEFLNYIYQINTQTVPAVSSIPVSNYVGTSDEPITSAITWGEYRALMQASVAGFDPERPVFSSDVPPEYYDYDYPPSISSEWTSGFDYQLTVPDGNSYIIDPTTGNILSYTASSGNTIYTVDQNGNIDDGNGNTLLNINWSGTPLESPINSIQASGQNPVNYNYDGSGNLVSVIDESGNQTTYSYQDPSTHLLTGITDQRGVNVLQAQYETTIGSPTDGELLSVTTKNGVNLPVTVPDVDGTAGVRTETDSAGDVTEEVYDSYGNVIRSIQPTFNSSGDFTGYEVAAINRTYGTAQDGYPSPGVGLITVVQSIDTYAPFQITGSDPDSLRYAEQPSVLTHEISYITGGEFLGQVASVSTPTDFSGKLQLTVNSNFTVADSSTNEIKPQTVTTEMITDEGVLIGIQSIVESQYDGQGDLTATFAVINPNNTSGTVVGIGTESSYSSISVCGTQTNSTGSGTLTNGTHMLLLTSTQNITATLVLGSGAVSIVPVSGILTSNAYYNATDISDNTAGAIGGQLEWTINAAGQETFTAYEPSGQTALNYTLKPVTNDGGSTSYVWTGTTDIYNDLGQMTDTYQAAYLENASDVDQGEPVLPTTTDGNGNVIVNSVPAGFISTGTFAAVRTYSTSVRMLHNDYNSLGQLADSIDQYGNETSYIYNSKGQVTETNYSDGTEVRTVYDAQGRTIWTTNKFVPADTLTLPVITTYTVYNDLGQVTQTFQYQGTSIQVDSSGNSTIVSTGALVTGGLTGTLTATTTQFYDSQGRVVETDSPTGLRTGTIYYPDGQVAYTGSLTNAASNTGSSAWFENIPSNFTGTAATLFLNSNFYTYTYNQYDVYDPTLGMFYNEVTDENGNWTKTYEDGDGRTVRTVYEDGSFTETLYSVGSQAVQYDQEQQGGQAYDNIAGTLQNTLAFTDPTIPTGGSETVDIAQRIPGGPAIATYNVYDISGNLVSVYQPAVVDDNPASSTFGQMVTPETQYVYDSSGNEIRQITADEQNALSAWLGEGGANTMLSFTGDTAFTYDQNGNELSETLPDGQTETFTFNIFGQQKTEVDFDGNLTTNNYFTSGTFAGMLRNTVYTGAAGSGKTAETASYTYTNLGQQQTVTDASGTTTYTYDTFGNQIQAATPEGTINYVYDPVTGNETETWTGTSHASATTDTVYGYDDQGRLTTVTVDKLNGSTPSGGAQITSYTYDAAGNKTSEIDANGVTTSYTYDDENRLISDVETNSSGLLFSQQYTLDPDGTRATSLEDQLQPGTAGYVLSFTDWTYDSEDRLTGEYLTDLPTSITLPYQYVGGTAGIALTWNGTEAYVSSGDTAGLVLSGTQAGIVLLSPAEGQPISGNPNDWILCISNGTAGDQVWDTFTLTNGSFTPDLDPSTGLPKLIALPTAYNLFAGQTGAPVATNGQILLQWNGTGTYVTAGDSYGGVLSGQLGMLLLSSSMDGAAKYGSYSLGIGSDWLLYDSAGVGDLHYALDLTFTSGTFAPDSSNQNTYGSSTYLPKTLELPAAANIFDLTSSQNMAFDSNGNVVASWDGGNAAFAPGGSATGQLNGSSPGMALLSPAEAAGFGGNGTDWLLLITTGSSTDTPTTAAITMTLTGATFSADGYFNNTGTSVGFSSSLTFTVGFSPTPQFTSPLVSTSLSFTISSSSNNYSNAYTYDLNSNRTSELHIGPADGPTGTTLYYYNGNDELIGQNTILPGSNGYSSSYTSSTYDANGSMTAQYDGSPATNVSFGTFSSTSALVSSNMPTNVLTATSTGTAGMILSAFGSNNATINAQTLLSTSGTTTAILVAGEATDADGNQDFMLAEYDPTTGLPITTFGSGGFVLTTLGNGTSMAANALTVGTSGNIVVAGWANANGTQYVALAEYNSSGSLITTFGSNGIVVTQVGNTAGANAITISGSNVLVAGYGKDSSGNQDILLAEYNSSGTLVSTFGTSGVTLDPVGSQATGNAILVSGSSIYVAGTGGGTQTAVLAQFNSNGTLTRVATHRSGSDNVWNAIGLSGSDIIVSGYDRNAAGKKAIALAEYNSLDSLVTSFGTGGVVMSSVNTSDAAATSMTIESGGKILVAGFGSYNALNSSNQSNATLALVVAQYTSSGQPDATFGVNGVAMEMAVPASASAVQVTSGGTIVVAGTMQTSPQDVYVAEFTTSSTAAATYTYDVRNEMVTATIAGVNTTYFYNDDGDRVSEETGGNTTAYLYDTANPTGYDQVIEEHVNGSSTPSVTYFIGTDVFGQATGSTNYYLMRDGQGDTRVVTNSSGQVLADYDYDAFGDALNFNPATAYTTHLTSDGVYDIATTFEYQLARWRDGFDFTQMDGRGYGDNSNPITLNTEIYGDGDPINGNDPTGHDDNSLANYAFSLAAQYTSENVNALQLIEGAVGMADSSLQGGPDITTQLTAIANFILSYNQPHKQALPSTGLLYANWDIEQLKQWGYQSWFGAPNPTAPGIVTVNGSSFATVTVAGQVYRPEDVNYFLWGLWNRATSASLYAALAKVSAHRILQSDAGRLAWTEAGYYDYLSLASPSAVFGVTPGQPNTQELDFGVGDLHWRVSPSGQIT